jgi:hypothetical protein
VALVGVNENSTNDATKRESFLTAARRMGLTATAKDIYSSNKGAVNTLESFFDNIDQYDGVMCGNDYIAASVLAWCNEHGIQVPEQLYISGLGDTLLCRYSNPTLTSATRSYIQTGEQAFNIWKQLNGDPSIFAIVVVVQCEIKTRGSTAYSPLPDAGTVLSNAPMPATMPEGTVLSAMNAARSLENCLSNCDPMDIRIIQGLLQGSSVEKIAEELFISVGTARYRLKKLYSAANVAGKVEFIDLYKRYIGNDKIFDDFTGNFQASNI